MELMACYSPLTSPCAMSKTNLPQRRTRAKHSSQAGEFAAEFGLIVVIFFTVMFGVIELARVIYMWNTLQEATRSAAHAAAFTNFRDTAAMDALRQHAIFRSSAGKLILGDPVTDEYIRIDYMALVRSSDGTLTLTPIPDMSLPSCPIRNRFICTANPSDSSCIRFVRVRVCKPGGGDACNPVDYEPLLPFVQLDALKLPTSTTIAKAETLGFQPGGALCP